MNSSFMSHQQRRHMELGPLFKVSSEKPKKRGSLALTGLVVQHVIHYTTAFLYLCLMDSYNYQLMKLTIFKNAEGYLKKYHQVFSSLEPKAPGEPIV